MPISSVDALNNNESAPLTYQVITLGKLNPCSSQCELVEWDVPILERNCLGESWNLIDFRYSHIGNGWHPASQDRRSIAVWWFYKAQAGNLLEWCPQEGRFLTHACWRHFDFMAGVHGELPSALLAIRRILRDYGNTTLPGSVFFTARVKQYASSQADDTSSPLYLQTRLPSNIWERATLAGFCPLSGALLSYTQSAVKVDSHEGQFVQCAMIDII